MKKLRILVAFLFVTIHISAQSNNCLYFDGLNDYILVGDVNNLGSNDFTIEAWINCESTSGIGQFVICKGLTSAGTPTNAGYGLRINDQNNNDVEFIIGDTTSALSIISSVSLSVDNWHHIAGVRSGIYMSLYVDGNLVAYDSTSSIFNVDTNIPLSIGAHNKGEFSSTAEFMNGKIDEVRIWNTTRTANEIIDNKDCAITSPEDNLIAVYNLNEGIGATTADSSGFNNDGSFTTTNPLWLNSSVAPICSTVSLGEIINTDNIELFPNPFINSITIKNGPLEADYHVYNMNGQLITSGTISHSNITLSNIVNGTYILEVSNENQVWRKKIVRLNSY